eukprot:13386794-Alexandrium_andersonii.AAC.1
MQCAAGSLFTNTAVCIGCCASPRRSEFRTNYSMTGEVYSVPIDELPHTDVRRSTNSGSGRLSNNELPNTLGVRRTTHFLEG